jgi:hypothetical protein
MLTGPRGVLITPFIDGGAAVSAAFAVASSSFGLKVDELD